MTISEQTGRMIFNGNGSNYQFSYTHTFFSANELKLVHYNITTGLETMLQPFQYTMGYSGNPPYTSCNITYPISGDPMAANEQLIVYRDTPLSQETDLSNQQAYFLEAIEAQLDRAMIIAQNLQDQSSRSLTMPVNTPLGKETILLGPPVAGNVLRWSDNPNDNVLDNVDLVELIVSDEDIQTTIENSFDNRIYNDAWAREYMSHVIGDHLQLDRGTLMAGTDWNMLLAAGFYRYDSANTGQVNMPADISDYGMLSIEVTNDRVRQFYTQAPPANALSYVRTYDGADWTAWEQLSVYGHRHLETDIIDLDKYTRAQVDSALAAKSNTGHTHFATDIRGDIDAATLGTLLPGQFLRNDQDGSISGNLTIIDAAPFLKIYESDTATVARMVISEGNLYIQAGAVGAGEAQSAGDVKITGQLGGNINSFTVRSGGADRIIWHDGNDSDLLKTNSIDGSFTTTDGKTITVVNGQITAII